MKRAIWETNTNFLLRVNHWNLLIGRGEDACLVLSIIIYSWPESQQNTCHSYLPELCWMLSWKTCRVDCWLRGAGYFDQGALLEKYNHVPPHAIHINQINYLPVLSLLVSNSAIKTGNSTPKLRKIPMARTWQSVAQMHTTNDHLESCWCVALTQQWNMLNILQTCNKCNQDF